MSENITNVST